MVSWWKRNLLALALSFGIATVPTPSTNAEELSKAEVQSLLQKLKQASAQIDRITTQAKGLNNPTKRPVTSEKKQRQQKIKHLEDKFQEDLKEIRASGKRVQAALNKLNQSRPVQSQAINPSNPLPPQAVLDQRKNVCQVSAPIPGTSMSSVGTGTYIGSGLVYTCAHLWNGRNNNVRVRVTFYQPHQQVLYGRMAGRDPKWDTAVIKLEQEPCCLEGVELAETIPKIGDPLYTAGQRSRNKDGLPGFKYGRVTSYNSPNPRAQYTDWATIQPATARSGDSGGPVFNSGGKLVGNLHRAAPGRTIIVLPGRTKRFLFPWNAKLEAHRQSILAGARPVQ